MADKTPPLNTEEEYLIHAHIPDTPQTRSPSFRPAYEDDDFLRRDELRPVRFQLELLKPELLQQEQGIDSTVVVFGSTRIHEAARANAEADAAAAAAQKDPGNKELQRAAAIAERIRQKAHFYEQARELGELITIQAECEGNCAPVIMTGSGGGIMEAANRGAFDAGGKSIGLNIMLPREQYPNKYVTPELSFQFRYFALRKMHFLLRAIALVVFPGGYGTLDELFETLTLIQTKKLRPLPVLLFGKEYWQRIIDFEALVDEGAIDPQDLDLFQYVETPREAWDIIKVAYQDSLAACR